MESPQRTHRLEIQASKVQGFTGVTVNKGFKSAKVRGHQKRKNRSNKTTTHTTATSSVCVEPSMLRYTIESATTTLMSQPTPPTPPPKGRLNSWSPKQHEYVSRNHSNTAKKRHCHETCLQSPTNTTQSTTYAKPGGTSKKHPKTSVSLGNSFPKTRVYVQMEPKTKHRFATAKRFVFFFFAFSFAFVCFFAFFRAFLDIFDVWSCIACNYS